MALVRFVLTSTVTIPWPTTWPELVAQSPNTPVSTPAVPASTVAAANASGIPVLITITGGTITAVTVNGTMRDQPTDAALDSLALVRAVIEGDLRASVVILGNGDPQAIALHLARLAALLIEARTDDPLAVIELLCIKAAPG
jgi:hypothetical protein